MIYDSFIKLIAEYRSRGIFPWEDPFADASYEGTPRSRGTLASAGNDRLAAPRSRAPSQLSTPNHMAQLTSKLAAEAAAS